jgi:hypothetical protein
VRKLGLLFGVLISVAVFERPSSAQSQSLTYQLFQRTLDSLRDEARVPGISAVIVNDGQIAWASGLGLQDLEGKVLARTDTPTRRRMETSVMRRHGCRR